MYNGQAEKQAITMSQLMVKAMNVQYSCWIKTVIDSNITEFI